ncbi:hypothetical protein EST38_g1525 [Candolleomyces aberdarensis]|uniref:Synaptobrevin n=1 Tax=Candolleomyces aberdarensis TaxID=2316362 RepID=A0A4Q2DXW9_9AGAR|nr:hypothetical protein EST38_g1525 [Candolleomyces aberdarensis]
MQLTTEQTHDEINLFRLVRRLEKGVELPRSSASSTYSYSPSSSYSNSPYLGSLKDLDVGESEVKDTTVWGKAQKELQKVKYARKLLKNVEGYEGNLHSSERQRRLHVLKMTLDTIETTLKSIERPEPPRPKSVLDQLPAPPEPSENDDAAEQGDEDRDELEALGVTTPRQKPTPLPLPLSADDNFLLSPPDPQGLGLSSSGLVSAIPGLMSAVPVPMPLDVPPRAGATTALENTSAFGSLAHRRPAPEKGKAKGTEAHTHLQTQLSDQLAQMAVQLKRNALHFAGSLEADKAVVEAAQSKIEGNMSFMETQRGRLKTLSGKTGGTTWLTLGIVLATVLLFMVMVGVIRVLRI